MDNKRQEELAQIKAEIEQFEESPLYEFRRKNDYLPVVGEGSPYARIMLIGEAPGKHEAESGRPFVGAAGRVLDDLLKSVGIGREDVYITNVVKDRPPENRDPTRQEIECYTPFLTRQVEVIRPSVIVPLGRFAMEFVLKRFDAVDPGEEMPKISQIHGQVVQAQAGYGEISIVPLYHPAVALYSGDRKRDLQEDFQLLRKYAG